MKKKKEKFEISYTMLARGAEYSTAIALNLLPVLHKTDLAVIIGVSMFTLHSVVSAAYYVYSMRAINETTT